MELNTELTADFNGLRHDKSCEWSVGAMQLCKSAKLEYVLLTIPPNNLTRAAGSVVPHRHSHMYTHSPFGFRYGRQSASLHDCVDTLRALWAASRYIWAGVSSSNQLVPFPRFALRRFVAGLAHTAACDWSLAKLLCQRSTSGPLIELEVWERVIQQTSRSGPSYAGRRCSFRSRNLRGLAISLQNHAGARDRSIANLLQASRIRCEEVTCMLAQYITWRTDAW